MRELPGACGGENGHLDQGPAHDAGVGCFGLIAEFGFALLYIDELGYEFVKNGVEQSKGPTTAVLTTTTYPLIHLLPTNIMQPTIQIPNTLHNILHLVLILRLDLARLTNGNIQSHLDRALGTGQPAASGGVRFSREAETVLAGVGGGEGEAAGVVLALGDDAVVVVEGLVDGDKHL